MSIFKFQSKPTQMQKDGSRLYVLCEDGSIYKGVDGEWEQVAAYEAPTKKVHTKKNVEANEAFNYFWDLWRENISCPSPKADALKAFMSLTPEESTALVYSVPLYAKTQPIEKHNFLKRAPSYINSRLFMEHASFVATTGVPIPVPIKEEVVDRSVDLTGKF